MGFAILLMPRLADAQTTGFPSGSGSPNVPVLVSGQMPSNVPTSQQTPTNVFQGTLTVGASYDDNATTQANTHQSDVDYSVMPTFSFEETRSRLVWGLSYSPGLEISQNLLYRNRFAQRFGGHMAWRTTPHGMLSAEQYYLVTTNPFENFASTQPGPNISPNESIFLPNIQQTLLLSHALYSYRSSAQVTVGLGGSFLMQKFDNTPHDGPTTSLIHSQIASGEGFISRQITARNQFGFQYRGQVLRFPQANARTTAHSFQLFDQINFSAHTQLTLYGGPEYALTSNEVAVNLGFVIITIPVKANSWNGSGGVMYTWTGDHLGVAIDFSRGISDGGGLTGAVELTSGRAQLNWRLSRDWSLSSEVSGSNDDLLAAQTSSDQLRVYTGEVSLHRKLWRDMGMRVFYQRFDQPLSFNGITIGNRNIIGASLEYSFFKPLGG